MRYKTGQLAMSALLSIALCACSAAKTQPTKTPPIAALATVSAATTGPASLPPSPTARPTPSPTLPPTPAPTPTPTPEPTPTPDPWAQHFRQDGPFLSIANALTGPWVYMDDSLSITVTVPRTGRFKNKYCLAEIYTRGPLPIGGFPLPDAKSKTVRTALPYKIARQNNAVLGITGDYITSGANKKGVMIRHGKVFYDKKDAPTLAFMPSGEMKVYEPGETTAKKLLALGVRDSFSFGPILVKGGKIHPSVEKHKLNYCSHRAAIGQIEPGHFIIIVTRMPVTLTDMANLFLDYKCIMAYNMDGGYSAAIVFMGEQINKIGSTTYAQRSLPDLMLIGSCPAVPDPKAPVYFDGVSVHPRNKLKPTSGLIPPAASPASSTAK